MDVVKHENFMDYRKYGLNRTEIKTIFLADVFACS